MQEKLEKDRLCEKNSSTLFFVCLQSWDTLTPRTPQNEKVSVPVAAQEEGGQRWSTCPIFFQLAVGLGDLSQAEKEIIVCKAHNALISVELMAFSMYSET